MTHTRLVVAAACVSLLACGVYAAEKRTEAGEEAASAEGRAGSPIVETGGAPSESEGAAAPVGKEEGTGMEFIVGAVVLAAAVVGTTVGLSRKGKVKVFRPGRPE